MSSFDTKYDEVSNSYDTTSTILALFTVHIYVYTCS